MDILIVDDDLGTRKYLGYTCRSMGLNPLFASDGLRALHILEDNQQIKLMITDISMPEMDGRELVTKLSEIPKFKHLDIIVISAVESFNEIKDILAKGVSIFLPKPVDAARLKLNIMEMTNCNYHHHAKVS